MRVWHASAAPHLCPWQGGASAADLERRCRWYIDVLGCEQLPRPPFTFGGAWLKAGANLTIHLIQQDPTVPRKFATGADQWQARRAHPLTLVSRLLSSK